ncbi:hypothetical protein M2336_001652 [Sphingobium sp. B1D7B]|uniref:hypothetical protein n=1 Tax=Sphingobium sp. B1D7B TaxID=2940578 RepID=UPI0022258B3D|nr:hypothetical protein [Sphingobium sp. B1D7B]MCW2405023.1 hypothetical protein [Sphingobium sp. B1D7B]
MTQGRAITMDGELWEWLKVGGATGVGIGGGAGVFMGTLLFFRWMLNFIAGRTDINQQRTDTIRNELIEELREDVKILKSENKEMREELAECERRHGISDRKIIELEGMLQAAGLARQMAQQSRAADTLARKERGE